MKRFAVSLISTILAFTAGLVTASSWSSNAHKEPAEPATITVPQPCPPKLSQHGSPTPRLDSFTVTPPQEFDFGQNGLKLVPERVQMKSESVGYDIDVSYPQILGTPYTDGATLAKVNRHIKAAAAKLYEWPLNPADAEHRSSQARSGIQDTVNFTYQIGLATDSLLSIHLIGYGYNGRTNRHVQKSFTLNYDLTAGKQLKLSDLFNSRSDYLEFIANYCTRELSRSRRIVNALTPTAENFEVWQITTNGIVFNFESCQVVECSEGEQMVAISFSELKPILNPGVPGKFKITYP